MRIRLQEDLPYVRATLSYHNQQMEFENVLRFGQARNLPGYTTRIDSIFVVTTKN